MKRHISFLVVIALIIPAFAFAGQGVVVERSPAYWYAYA